MKQVDRERIQAALVGAVPRDFPALSKELEEMCAEDVRRIEPIIDEIVIRERNDAVYQVTVARLLVESSRSH